MKKYILISILFLITLFIPQINTQTVQAEHVKYAYVPTQTVYFYSDESEQSLRTGLFILPQTYYVKILSEEGAFYHVEYQTDTTRTKKIYGYVKISDVTEVNYEPETPYLFKIIELTYTLGEKTTKQNDFSTVKKTCSYYGDYREGTDTYSYVFDGENFGYVQKPENLTYPKNDEFTTRTPREEEQETKNPSSHASPAQITLIVLLCMLIPAVSALILRSPKKPPYETDDV